MPRKSPAASPSWSPTMPASSPDRPCRSTVGSICIELSEPVREYPDRPWVGVGIVVWRDDKVLLVRRAKPPRLGEWSIPGGAQSLGETVFEAAIREVHEEAGIDIRPTAIITVVDSVIRDAELRAQYHYTLVEISAEWVAGEPVAAD